MTTEKLKNALTIYGVTLYRSESYHPDYNAQRNLTGRSHYVDNYTLNYFKSKVLRSIHSANGLYFIIRESLPHPDYKVRVRRNVVFNVFGEVVTEICHTNARKADIAYYDAITWCDSKEAVNAIHARLTEKLERDLRIVANVREALDD